MLQRGRVGSRLLPPGFRRPAAVLIAVGAAACALLGGIYHGQQSYDALDAWVVNDLLGAFHGHGRGLWHIEELASPPSAVALAVAVAVAACVLRAWRFAVLSIVGLAVTGILVEVLKLVIGRTLFGNLALPSGHTAGATSVATTAALLLVARVRTRLVPVGAIALTAVTLVAAAVGIAMTTLRLHYATDTVAGYGIGLAATLSVAFAVDVVGDRMRTDRPTPTT
jgi:undecaprenyl-diphosphatase